MRHEIIFSVEAVEDLQSLRAHLRAFVRDSIIEYLRYEPEKVSKARIKRLHGLSCPQYRLRIDDVRVFYDVIEDTVEILGVVAKAEAEAWLERVGRPDETDSSF